MRTDMVSYSVLRINDIVVINRPVMIYAGKGIVERTIVRILIKAPRTKKQRPKNSLSSSPFPPLCRVLIFFFTSWRNFLLVFCGPAPFFVWDY